MLCAEPPDHGFFQDGADSAEPIAPVGALLDLIQRTVLSADA